MNSLRFITASLRHYRRVHIAVAMGVAVATAVLTGALLVGDSVSGSLRDLTLQRLGYIDSALVAGHMFREELADELAANVDFQKQFAAVEPAILTSGTLQSGSGRAARRATAISVIGCRPSFWLLGQGGPQKPLTQNEIALTESLARELGVEAGTDVLLRIPITGAVPADSPLGEKNDTSLARRFKVAAVLPPQGLARFALMPSQHLPRNVFLPLKTLQNLLEQPGKSNAILVATDQLHAAAGEDAKRVLERALRPQPEDYGFHVEHVASPTECFQISADRLVLPSEAVRAANRAYGEKKLQPIVTYLANTLVAGEGDSQRAIPYSTITGVDSIAEIGPLLDESGQPIVLANDEIVLNRWAADDLQVKIGDPITVTFYEPESTHGRLREHQPPPVFKLRAIVELETADARPTPAADPNLTPELPGVTDQQSINDWELPFELVETIRQQDEDYWDKYRTTPKAFVSLTSATQLWPSRWGTVGLLRIPPGDAASAAAASDQLAKAIDPAALGMTFLPVKRLGLESASGTTPFSALFLGFSFFLIAAALMLIALLFQLGIQQRARELGTLAAVGIGRKRMAGLLGREGLVVAAIGAAVGVGFGIAYAWLMIAGLRTWWLAAISTPFLELHIAWPSLLAGWVIGVAVSWLTIRWSIRRLVRQSVGRLLSGSLADDKPAPGGHRPARKWRMVRIALLLVVAALVALGFQLEGQSQAGVFFGSGAMMLVILLREVRHRLRNAGRVASTARAFSLSKLSALNTARNPGRSTLTVGLVASASFLIVAISAFRLETGEAGTGGFELMATSDRPIHYDLNTPEGRRELGITDRPRANETISDEQLLSGWRFYSLRVAAGEDASCLNLYRPTQPRVLGVSDEFIERGGFAWADTHPATKDGDSAHLRDTPWKLLHVPLPRDDDGRRIVPVVLDASTAIYSLHLKGVGSRLTIRDAADNPVTLEVVGLLKNSVLQGSVLISEADFLRLFPDTAGYRFFLIEKSSRHAGYPLGGPAAADGKRSLPATLESTLADEGFDIVDAREQLEAFLAVQNTYLSTFQSLGALGLLLGTIGLAVVQLRSVLERRGELALLRASGFQSGRLLRMVVLENAVLLLGGLAIGCIAAAVALIPQWAPQQVSVPWQSLAVLLGTIAAVGIVAGWLATRAALQAPIVPALRGD